MTTNRTTTDRHRPTRAFTLLELVVVLALLGLLAALTAASAVGSTQPHKELTAARALESRLATLRVSAMRNASPLRLTISAPDEADDDQSLRIDLPGERDATLPTQGLRLVDEEARRLATQTITFDHAGRSRTRAVRLLSEDASRRDIAASRVLAPPYTDPERALTREPNRGRAWVIDLDPVSGSPSLRAHGRGVPTQAKPPQTDE